MQITICDRPEVSDLLVQFLGQLGHEVKPMPLTEALATAKREETDLMIVAVGDPHVEKQVLEAKFSIPFLATSGTLGKGIETRKRLLTRGAVAVLAKPFALDDLRLALLEPAGIKMYLAYTRYMGDDLVGDNLWIECIYAEEDGKLYDIFSTNSPKPMEVSEVKEALKRRSVYDAVKGGLRTADGAEGWGISWSSLRYHDSNRLRQCFIAALDAFGSVVVGGV